MAKIAPSYSDQQVLLSTIDIVANPSMMQYLNGRAPITRLFHKGKMTKTFLQGNHSEADVRSFIDGAIAKAGE